MQRSRLAVLTLAGCLGMVGVLMNMAPAQQPADARVDFAKDIYPLFKRACFECHGADKQRGKLRLDTSVAFFKGGSSGPALVPGKSAESELLRRLMLPKDDPEIMPARGEPLTKAQIAMVRAWIDQGAVWPKDFHDAGHWAYLKPVRPPLPEVKNAKWPRAPIDHFVLARLEREGLQPSPEADRATLIRRLTLDLIGLPPTLEETDAYLQDTAPNAYETLVDRLLASAQFGERWARSWLDLARYADSHGFQKDDFRNSFAYRDWVIKALNADMPFDQFTIEQLAGDLLAGATLEQKIATGFHRCAPTNVEAGSEPEETRVNQVFDRVNTTGAVWLGATLECAQCHDHKYDPFTQKEYYQLFAFFNNTALEADRANPKVPGSIQFLGPYLTVPDEVAPGKGKIAPPAIASLKKLEKQLEARKQKFVAELDAWEKATQTSLGQAGEVHVLDIADFHSLAGAPHKELADRSVLLVDDPPDKDSYTITAHTELKGITGFKLEALTHPSLPGQGPGRGDAERPNFVLNTFAVKAGPKDAKAPAVPVKLVKARADFSQTGFDPGQAIDNDPKSAWAIAPQFHKPHWAIFEADKALGFNEGTSLTFTLVQNFGKGRTIGRLRLSAVVGAVATVQAPAEIIAILKKPKMERNADQQARLLDYRLDQDEEIQRLREQLMQVGGGKEGKGITTLVMQELPTSRSTALMLRGDHKTPGEKVQAGVPAVLHKLPPGPANRLTLARWLVSLENPLTARVTVNRWWAEIFGHGLVSTVEDFGMKGEPPTHPELLDWLAAEFMAPSEPGSATKKTNLPQPWSMKHVLRQIVLSATYRQSSKITQLLKEKDDQNRLYARGPRFRMDAEMIRDNALHAAGLLSLKQFGPPIRPYQPDGLWNRIGGARVEYVLSPGEDRHRRGIYVVWKRSVLYPSFVNFDATARYACTVKRSRANTPLQALTLLNDPVYVEAALALAKRVLVEQPKANVDHRLRHAFRLCLIRGASAAELGVLTKLHAAQASAARANPKAAKELVGAFPLPTGTSVEEFAAWYAVAAALLNLDETITKN